MYISWIVWPFQCGPELCSTIQYIILSFSPVECDPQCGPELTEFQEGTPSVA